MNDPFFIAHDAHRRRVNRNNLIGFFMLVALVIAFFWCMLAPLFAQERTYTNADLGKKLPPVETGSGDKLAGLRANQFQLTPVYDGPTVVIFSQREGSRLYGQGRIRREIDLRDGPNEFPYYRFGADRRLFFGSQLSPRGSRALPFVPVYGQGGARPFRSDLGTFVAPHSRR